LKITLRAGDAKLVGSWRKILAVGLPGSVKKLNLMKRIRGSLTKLYLGISDRLSVSILNKYKKSG